MSALGLIKINIALTASAYYKELRTTFNKECTFFYCYFSTTILSKVVVANEHEINFYGHLKLNFGQNGHCGHFKKCKLLTVFVAVSLRIFVANFT